MGLAAAALVGALTLAACGNDSDNGNNSGGGGSAAPSSNLKIGMAYDIGGRGDKSFNDSAAVGLDTAEKNFGIPSGNVKELSARSGETDTDRATRLELLAKGGFQVSSEREAGEVKYVGLKSLYGNSARIVNPWGNQQVRVRRVSDNSILTTTSAPEFTLNTSANTVYVVERTAKPLSSYGSTRLTGTANQGVKSLPGTSSTLGLGRTADPMVNDTALTYDGDWYSTSSRGYGDYNDDTHHSTTVGAKASYTFTGTGIQYLSERNGDMGTVDVSLDNVPQTTVDLHATGARQVQQVVWQKTGLPRGSHTVTFVNRSTAVGMIDALKITP